jgi:hypothetical protein
MKELNVYLGQSNVILRVRGECGNIFVCSTDMVIPLAGHVLELMCHASCGTSWAVSTCEFAAQLLPLRGTVPLIQTQSSPQVGNFLPPLNMNGMSFADVSLTCERYGCVCVSHDVPRFGSLFPAHIRTLPIDLVVQSLIDLSERPQRSRLPVTMHVYPL